MGDTGKGSGSLERDLYILCLLVPLIAIPAYLVCSHVVGNYIEIPCILYEALGVYCPGCGGSRAIAVLLRGEILWSIWYHPLVIYFMVIYLGFVLTQTLERLHIGHIRGWRFHRWWLYTAGGLLVFNCIFKNILKFCFQIVV